MLSTKHLRSISPRNHLIKKKYFFLSYHVPKTPLFPLQRVQEISPSVQLVPCETRGAGGKAVSQLAHLVEICKWKTFPKRAKVKVKGACYSLSPLHRAEQPVVLCSQWPGCRRSRTSAVGPGRQPLPRCSWVEKKMQLVVFSFLWRDGGED